jgi:hypothetical protein
MTTTDINSSIQLARELSDAVKTRRARIHAEAPLPPEQEQAEDDRLFLGAAIFLAQKMKPTKR